MASLNRFVHRGDEIEILRDEWNKMGFTTYRDDYYEELTSVTWRENNGYLVSSKFGALHRYIMGKWYGEDVLAEMTKQGWIVDHMNNDGFDCRISNLEFLPTRHNVAKGQTVDVEAEAMRKHIALCMFKDFSTGLYQIHLSCNDPISLYNADSDVGLPLARLKLLYDCDYRIVINDARDILLNYDLYKKVDLQSLHYIDWKADFFETIVAKEGEVGRAFIERNGTWYACIGNGVWFHSSSVESGWKPREEVNIL